MLHRHKKLLALFTMLIFLLSTVSVAAAAPTTIYGTYNGNTVAFTFDELVAAYGNDVTAYQDVWANTVKTSMTINGVNLSWDAFIAAVGEDTVATPDEYAALPGAVTAPVPATISPVGAEGAVGAEIPNPDAPVTVLAVESVSAITNNTVEVTFNSTVSASQAVASNFTITSGTATLAVNDAKVAYDGKSVILTTANQTPGTSYSMVVAFGTDATKNQSFVGGIADAVAPSAASAAAYNNTNIVVTFTDNTRIDETTAENIANYSIDKGLTVTSAKLIDSAVDAVTYSGVRYKSVLLNTSAQTAGTVYTVTVNGVKDIAGNTPSSALTATFAGKAADTVAPATITAAPYNNTKVVVTFNENVDEATAETVANYSINNNLTVTAAELITSPENATLYAGTVNRSVVLTTSAQTAGTVYTVSVNGVKDQAGNAISTAITTTFAGKAADTTAPATITVLPYTNVKVVVTFNENVDATTAQTTSNYTINNGLTVSAASLITTAADAATYGGTLNRSVVLTTSTQTAGTVYTISVTGVKDTSGNAITTAITGTFAGKAADTTAPTVTSVQGLSGNKLQIVFNDASPMDETSVRTLTNYSISTLGYPVSVDTYNAATKTLVLNTATQTNATIYTVTINNVKDSYGNAIAANTQKTFAGVGTAGDPIALSSVTAINNRQIQVVFNKDVDDATVTNTDFQLKKGNAAAVAFETIGSAETPVFRNNSTTYTLTLATGQELTSDVYTLSVDNSNGSISDTGGTALDTAVTIRAQKTFGGIDTAAPTPTVSSILHTAARQITVTFANEVALTNFDNASDVYVTYDSTTINLGGTAVATYAARDAIDKKKVVFTFASDLAADKVAKLNIKPAAFDNIEDVTGNIDMVKNATTNYEVTFGTQAFTATTLKLISATGVDEQTIELKFNQPINFNSGNALTNPGAGTDNNFLQFKTSADAAIAGYDLKYAEKTGVDTVRVYFVAGANITEGNVYKVVITDNAAGDELFTTLSGVKLDASVAADATATWGYNATVNAEPYLVSVTPLSDTRIQLTFSESISVAPTTDGTATSDIKIYNGSNEIAAGQLSDATDLGSDKKNFYLDLTGGKFVAGTTYTVKMPNSLTITDKYGVDTIKKASASDANLNSVTFGGSATAATAPTATDLYVIWNDEATPDWTNDAVVSDAGIAQDAQKTLEIYFGTTAPDSSTEAKFTFDLDSAGIVADTATALTQVGASTIAAGDTVYYRYVDHAFNKSEWVADGTIAAAPVAALSANTYVLTNATKYKVAAGATAALSVDQAYTAALANDAGANTEHLSIVNINSTNGHISYVDYDWVETVVGTLEAPTKN